MFMLAIVIAPALARGKNESVTYVGDLGCPAAIQFRQANATTKPLYDRFDLQEFRFRLLTIVRAGKRTLGTGTQLVLKIANLSVCRGHCLQHDETSRVVVDSRQGLID